MHKEEIKASILEAYTNKESQLASKIVTTDRSHLGQTVNFKISQSHPVHRWLNYKEGYSPNLVKWVLDKYGTQSAIVFDPFGGVGTTILTASKEGFNSYSNDVNPLAIFASKVKCTHYTEEQVVALEVLSRELKSLDVDSFDPAQVNNATVLSYFQDQDLNEILKLSSWISTFDNKGDEALSNVFKLAFLSSLETVSTHKKDGNGWKRKKNLTKKSFLDVMSSKMEIIISDIAKSSSDNSKIGKTFIFQQSSFNKYVLPESADLVICSPPYPNCFDYSKVYLVELWFGGFFKSISDQVEFRENSVSSHVHYKWETRNEIYGEHSLKDKITEYLTLSTEWISKPHNKRIPNMIASYFNDMGACLYHLSNNIKNGAIVSIIIGNGSYSTLPIATDLILIELSEQFGFEVIHLEFCRHLGTSPQQRVKMTEKELSYLRESLIVLRYNA